MRTVNEKKLSLIALLLLITLFFTISLNLPAYPMRIFILCGIYVTLGLSLNLINGFTGMLSLGHAGFMAIGAYTSALLTITPETKEMLFYLKPITPFLAEAQTPFIISVLLGGVFAAIVGLLIGAPVLRLKDDYLAIATLGASEIIRVILTNTQSITNGSLGLKNIPRYTNVWWSWGVALFTFLFIWFLIKSSYGRALKAIREDDIAAEAMGISLFKHKLIAFVTGSFFAGIGGALLGALMGTIDPLMFRFFITFNVILIVVMGGNGSLTGTVISAIVVTVMMEFLRILDSSFTFGALRIEGRPGMRMVIFSALLILVILFYNRGIMGNKEFSWKWLFGKCEKLFKRRPLQ